MTFFYKKKGHAAWLGKCRCDWSHCSLELPSHAPHLEGNGLSSSSELDYKLRYVPKFNALGIFPRPGM